VRYIVLLWGELPGLWKRVGAAPRPYETASSTVLSEPGRIHIVGNVKTSYLPSDATAEMDFEEAPPNPRVIRWIEVKTQYLGGGGVYAAMVESFEDFRELLALAKINPYARFIVEFPPEAKVELMFTVFEALRYHPQMVFRDPAFHALRGQYMPPSDTVVVGGKVYREVDWRSVIMHKLSSPPRYAAPELGYIASGYFAPENDPYLWWAKRFTSFTVVELPPAEPEKLPEPAFAPVRKEKRGVALPPPPARRGTRALPAQASTDVGVELAEQRPSDAERGDETEQEEGGEEHEVEEVEVDLS
jgi:hypothetical protein